MRKIVFYYNHLDDIGHIVRLRNIFKYIELGYKRQFKIYVFRGGNRQRLQEQAKKIQWIDLPFPFYSKINFKYPVRLDAEKLKTRSGIILSHLKKIRPDIFITEFFPFGLRECRFELLPAFDWLRTNSVKLFASVPIPYFVHTSESLKELLFISGYFDKIMVHSPKTMEFDYIPDLIHLEKRISKTDFLNVFELLKNKLIFTGYILPYPHTHSDGKKMTGDYIIVHRGGGTTSSELISLSIKTKKNLGPRMKLFIVAGPATSKAELEYFRSLIAKEKQKGIIMVKYVHNFFEYLRNCKLAVGTCGASAAEILFLRKRAVLLPFLGFPGKERCDQLARAQMLKDYLGSSILDNSSLTPAGLAKAIKCQLSLPPSVLNSREVDPGCFSGGKNTADLIMSA